MQTPRILTVLAGTGCLLAIMLCSGIFYVRTHHEYTKPYPYDLAIFSRASQRFQREGILYQRSDTMAETYKPGVPLYKFPPAYMLGIHPWVDEGHLGPFFNASRIGTLVLYVASLAWLGFIIHRSTGLPRAGGWALLVFLHGSLSSGFIHAFELQTAEIVFLFLLTAGLACLRTWPALSGSVIAMMAATKLYPLYMLPAGFLSAAPSRWLSGFAVTGAGLACAGLLVFGLQENLFYATQVIPVLWQEQLAFHPYNISPASFLGYYLLDQQLTPARHLAGAMKAMAIMAAIALGFRARQCTRTQDLLTVYAFLVSSIFICLPNCWIQYWVMLLIPLLVISANLIRQRRWLAVTGFSLVSLLMNIEPGVFLDILAESISRSGVPIEAIHGQISTHGLEAVLLEHSPLAWTVYWATELRPLMPLGIWLILARMSWSATRPRITPHLAHAASA